MMMRNRQDQQFAQGNEKQIVHSADFWRSIGDLFEKIRKLYGESGITDALRGSAVRHIEESKTGGSPDAQKVRGSLQTIWARLAGKPRCLLRYGSRSFGFAEA